MRLKSLLDSEFQAAHDDFFSDLEDNAKVSLALDSWTSPWDQCSFLAIVAYYVSINWKYRQVLIGFEQLVGAHTGENLAIVVENVAIHFKLADRLFAMTADNASNNTILRRSLQRRLADRGITW